jgi:tRNA-2-methylthio-N6-dimethylallyladenosine synthase
MEKQLAQREMRERLQRLNYVQNANSLECNQELVGTTQEILVDEWAGNKAKGRTTTNKLVFFDSPQDLTGTFVDVKITEAKTWSLAGELGDEA